MRVLRVWLCVLMLATFVVAESPSVDPPSSSPAPAQEPQTESSPPTTTEAQPVDRQPASFNPDVASSQDQLIGEIRLMTRYSELGGDPSRSFRVQRHRTVNECADPTAPPPPAGGQPPLALPCSFALPNNLVELNFFSDQRFFITRRVQALSMYRGTDDRSIDPERNSLQRAYVRIFGPRDEYIFGDALVNFSRLSFNQNIKGVSATSMIGESWKLSSVGGIFIDRWGSLYKEIQGKPYTAGVFGSRLEYKLPSDSTLGVNYSTFSDILSTAPAAGGGIPTNNMLSSVDMRLNPARGWRMEGEFGYSFTDFDKRDRAGCVLTDANGVILDSNKRQEYCDSRTLLPGMGWQGDWGARLETSYRMRRTSLRGSYTRYQPRFASSNARQVDDLQDMVMRASFDVLDWLTVDGGVRRSNDNLKGQDGFTTVLWGPEGRVMLHNLPIHRRATLEFGYRHRIIEGTDLQVGNSLRRPPDRFVRMPFVELSVPVATTFFNLGYEQRRVNDRVSPNQTSKTDRVYAGIRGAWDLGGWSVNPVMRMEVEHMSHRPGIILNPNPPTVSDPTLVQDTNRLAFGSLMIEPPKWFVFEGSFRSASATLTARRQIIDPFDPAVRFEAYANGYSRPQYRGAITYKVMNDENIRLMWSVERNTNFYFTSNNYDERVWAFTLIYRFGRRGH